jgi:predicted RNA binding protein YcfA (HicA-like mRNA interferase family)
MTRREKTLERILGGDADANIAFDDLRQVLLRKGFRERVKGSHHIFTHEGFSHRINLQRIGRDAKAYQVRQIREILIDYPEL